MKRLLSLILAVTTAAAAGAQVLSVEGPRTRVPQYGRADFSDPGHGPDGSLR